MPTQLSHPDSRPLAKRLAAYGCTEFIPLDEKLSAPEQLNYLDLLPMRSNEKPTVSAVAEYQGTALLYLVDASGDVKSDAASLAALQRQLANRSDPAWLGVVRPGSLEIFPIGFHEGLPIGMQLIGAHHDEGRIVQIGDAFERSTDHSAQRPPALAKRSVEPA